MSAARDLFREILEGGYGRIVRFKEEKQEENLHLDFKEKADPLAGLAGENDQKNYAKALSGFANSDGGVVVWGVVARKVEDIDVAQELKPIRGHRTFLTDLNCLASRLVATAIEGVQNEAIEDPNDESRGFVVTFVPPSDLAPHRTESRGQRKYFRRSGDSFREMEHFELEDMFGRRRKAILQASCGFGGGTTSTSFVTRMSVVIRVNNIGRHPAYHVAIRMSEPEIMNFAPRGSWLQIDRNVIAIRGDQVIHPTTDVVAAVGDILLPPSGGLPGPLIIGGTIFCSNAGPSEFRFEFWREQVEEFIRPLPPGVWVRPAR